MSSEKKKKEKLIEITFAKNRVILLRVSTSILNRLFFFRAMEQLEWNEIDGGYIYIYIYKVVDNFRERNIHQ